jgi:hypothetical protein
MQYCYTTAALSCKMEENFVTRASQLILFAERHIRVPKCRAGLATCTRKMFNVDDISARKSERNAPSGRRKYRDEDNIKMYYKVTGLKNFDLFDLA